MRSRGFTKRISIYETTLVPDGFGGNTVTDALLVTTWANIKTFSINSKNITDLGVIDLNNSIIIKTRKRSDLTYNIQTQYIIYRNEKYTCFMYRKLMSKPNGTRLFKPICSQSSHYLQCWD